MSTFDSVPPAWSDAFVYSGTLARALNYDGACYTNPTSVDAVDLESVAAAVAIYGCYSSTCGPSALYCYTSVEAPTEKVTVPQPLYYPAPYVSFGTNPARCFADPIFQYKLSGSAMDGLDIRAYSTSDYCGKLALYSNCTTGASLVVVFPAASTPHSFISYSGLCYSFDGTTTTTGTVTVTLAGSVTPVSNCADAVCTGASASGTSYAYFDSETNDKVSVAFDNLDLGLPHFGVAPAAAVDGRNGLRSGQQSVRFRRDPLATVIGSVSGAGVLHFEVTGLPCSKKLIILRSGVQTAYPLSPSETGKNITVHPGDAVLLSVATILGRINTLAVGKSARVQWVPVVSRPRLYDTAVLNTVGNSPIVALGFCGISAHQSYVSYRTLPTDRTVTGELNPDSYVTVQGATGSEVALLRNRAPGDLPPATGFDWYGGQGLAGPLTFRFYADRDAGGHGEMDVWLATSGTFPGVLVVDDFRALVKGTASYRKIGDIEDTHRNNLRVAASTDGVYLPSVYSASDGELITIHSQDGTVVYNDKTYIKGVADLGLSQRIVTT